MSDPQPAVVQKSLWSAILLAFIVAALNIALWAYVNRPVQIPNWEGKIEGFAFSAFQRYQSPLRDNYPTEEELASDLRIIAKNAKRVRTYSSLESAAIPRLARDLGLDVMPAPGWTGAPSTMSWSWMRSSAPRGAGPTSTGSWSATRPCCATTSRSSR